MSSPTFNSPVPLSSLGLKGPLESLRGRELKKSSSFTIENAKIQGPKLYALNTEWTGNDMNTIQNDIMDHVEYTLARTKYNFDKLAAYQATAYSVRDRIIERWNETQQFLTDTDPKRVYYLSMEFLMGRSLRNTLFNMGIQGNFANALVELGYRLEDLYDEEKDAALGNGGLGRLAACFMDSLATMRYPAWGYGLRYHYGMFEQGIYNGYQTEVPDYWLTSGNPWDIERVDVQYTVRYYGHVVEKYVDADVTSYSWEGGELVRAVAYDTPVPGYKTVNTNNIRLWVSRPHKEFDLSQFNEGNYLSAVEAKQRSENITSVLYPNDNTYAGKELRLKQQYFFVSATLSDVVRRFKKVHGSSNWELFPSKVAIQLNDTHPSLSIVELLRKLIDDEGLKWDAAWPLITATFAYTNHTVLPEALETWPVSLMQHVLPRHMQLIYQINHRFLRVIENAPDGWGTIERQRAMSIIEEGYEKRVRMAHLAIVGSHAVNGVAAMHTEIVKHVVFADFFALWPEKFHNITNGVTPRRWIEQANPSLSELLARWLHTNDWTTNLTLLSKLKDRAADSQFQHEWRQIRIKSKERLSALIKKVTGVETDPSHLFDVQIKRIHEYKRQLLNILHVIHKYQVIRKTPAEERKNIVPRVVIFAGKAAPGYVMAKRHIKLINSVAEVVNNDKEIDDLLKVVFIPNYSVSMAEVLIPAADINQQISTAGTEASGTSNMKFAMNGSLIIGTLDGANVEISEEVGQENLFIFGLKTDQVEAARALIKDGKFKLDPRLEEVFRVIQGGVFGPPETFQPIVDTLLHNDYYLLTADFPLYLEAQARVDETWKNQDAWTRKSILNSAGTAKFSSDRSILEYAEKIWGLKPCPVTQSLHRLY